MKRIISIILLTVTATLACLGQSVSKLISIKDLIEKRYGTYCIRAEFAGIYDSAKLTFFVNQDDYIIPIRLLKKDLGAEKRFLALNLKEGDIVYVRGTLDEIYVDFEEYKGLVDAVIIDEEDLGKEEDGIPAIEPDEKPLFFEEEREAIPFQLVDVKPRFNGDDAFAFSEWVNAHLEYPKTAKENGVQGRVTLQFTVEADGSVSNVTLLRGVEPSLDKEAIRVVSSSPKWTPGEQRGIPVRVTYTFPVIFQLR